MPLEYWPKSSYLWPKRSKQVDEWICQMCATNSRKEVAERSCECTYARFLPVSRRGVLRRPARAVHPGRQGRRPCSFELSSVFSARLGDRGSSAGRHSAATGSEQPPPRSSRDRHKPGQTPTAIAIGFSQPERRSPMPIDFQEQRISFGSATGGPRTKARQFEFPSQVRKAVSLINGFHVAFTNSEHPSIDWRSTRGQWSMRRTSRSPRRLHFATGREPSTMPTKDSSMLWCS